jgi:segregation and condensation protein A
MSNELPLAVVQGTPLDTLPTDLYVPPDALQIFLERFEGPLDLLLYLIQHQNLNILEIPLAEIIQQYLHYIELMQQLNLDLAAEYLLMASWLTELKSRLLLPTRTDGDGKAAADPHTQLIKQLQEYAQYKQAAEELAQLPQLGREIFLASVQLPTIKAEMVLPNINWAIFLQAIQEVMERATLFSSHQIMREPLSVRERMTLILARLKITTRIDFIELFTLEEGRAGVVVTLLAILELVRESLIKIVQTQPFATIQVLANC